MKNNSTLKKVQYADAVAASKEYFGGDDIYYEFIFLTAYF